MKKSVSMLLAAVMVLSLTACGGGTTASNPSENPGNTGAQPAVDPIVLRASTPSAPEHPWSKGLDELAGLISEKTQGRYQIDVYYNASLSENSEKTMTEQIMTGALDLGVIPGPLAGKSFSAFSFPFQFDDREHIARVCESDVAQKILADTEPSGLHSVAYVENGFRQITNNKHAIKTPADMADLKIRTPQSATTMAAISAMGANATAVSAGELYVALSQHTVDGQENALSTIYNNGYYEVQKYCSVLDYNWSPAIIAVNSTLWATMSPEDQEIFNQAIEQVAQDVNQMQADGDQELIEQLTEKGMEVYVFSPEERDAFKALCDNDASIRSAYVDTVGEELLTQFQEAVESCRK